MLRSLKVPSLRLRGTALCAFRVSVVRPTASFATAAGPKLTPEQDAAEKARLIAAFPYAWPWGQTITVKTPRADLKITIPQDRPAPKQHKLAYTIDAAPPDVPSAPSYFVGPIGKVSHGIFNEALKTNSLESVKQALWAFVHLLEDKREIRMNLMSPITSFEQKFDYVRELAVSVGANEAVSNALVGLQRDKKLHKLNEIAKNFNVLLAEHRKEKSGAIISAEPLSEQQYAAITAKMNKLVKPDEKLIINREIEPALVGGFIIRIGNRAQDLSVQSQITRMEKHLKAFFAQNEDAASKVLAQ